MTLSAFLSLLFASSFTRYLGWRESLARSLRINVLQDHPSESWRLGEWFPIAGDPRLFG